MTNIISSQKFEIPEGTGSVVVEIYNEDGSFRTSYTITDYIALAPKQTVMVIAVK